MSPCTVPEQGREKSMDNDFHKFDSFFVVSLMKFLPQMSSIFAIFGQGAKKWSTSSMAAKDGGKEDGIEPKVFLNPIEQTSEPIYRLP